MKQFVIRNLNDDVHAAIRQWAVRHGRSLEAEVREILARAAAEEASAKNTAGRGHRIAARFSRIGLRKGEEIPEHSGSLAQSVDFS